MIMSHSIAWWHRAFCCKQFGALMAFLLTVPILCQDCGWLQLWRGKWWTRDRFKDNGTRRSPITPNSIAWHAHEHYRGDGGEGNGGGMMMMTMSLELMRNGSVSPTALWWEGQKERKIGINQFYTYMFAVVRLNGGIYTSWRGLEIQAGWWRLLQSISCAA